MDCFTLRVRKDGAAGRLYESPFSFSAPLKCTVFFPMTTHDLHSGKTLRDDGRDNLKCTSKNGGQQKKRKKFAV
jgi:hypothetical protein